MPFLQFNSEIDWIKKSRENSSKGIRMPFLLQLFLTAKLIG